MPVGPARDEYLCCPFCGKQSYVRRFPPHGDNPCPLKVEEHQARLAAIARSAPSRPASTLSAVEPDLGHVPRPHSPYYSTHEEANFSDRLGVSIENPSVDHEPGPRMRIVIEGETELVKELWAAVAPKLEELNERLSAAHVAG